jgi:hypothetical protein
MFSAVLVAELVDLEGVSPARFIPRNSARSKLKRVDVLLGEDDRLAQ